MVHLNSPNGDILNKLTMCLTVPAYEMELNVVVVGGDRSVETLYLKLKTETTTSLYVPGSLESGENGTADEPPTNAEQTSIT